MLASSTPTLLVYDSLLGSRQQLLLDGLLLLGHSVWAQTQLTWCRPANADRCTAGSTVAAHPRQIGLLLLGYWL
jgi:hypothetical protein